MRKIKRKWNMLTEVQRDHCIREIITHYQNEKDQEIGVIAAEHLLDFFLELLVEKIYDKAIVDSKELIKRRFEDIEINLDLLLNR
ncbi:DUF2164 family protein [Patescibacteria group bacterium]